MLVGAVALALLSACSAVSPQPAVVAPTQAGDIATAGSSAAPPSATPATPPDVFSSDAAGLTTPDAIVRKGTLGPDQQALTPVLLCRQTAPDQEQALDLTRRRVEETVCAASMWFDGLFGNQYYVGPSRKVYGNLDLTDNYSQFYGNKIRVRFNARFDLPNIEQHVSAFIGRDNEEDFVHDRLDKATLRSNFPQVEDHDKVFAGLGYALPSNAVFHTDMRIGVRGLAHPEAFLQARARYNAYSDDRNLLMLRATPFWTTHDHLGITLGADYNHVLNNDLLFRWSNVSTRSQATSGVDWRTAWTLYQAVRPIRSGFAYELFIRGATGDDVAVHEYGTQTTFRHPLLQERLYAEWVLGYSFPREHITDERKGSVLAGAGLQMPFGQR